MIKILFVLLLASNASAQTSIGDTQGLFSIPGLTQAVADAAKRSKAVGLVDLQGRISGGVMLPLRTWHDLNGTSYVAFGPGAVIKQGEHFRGRIVLLVDASALGRRWESHDWYNKHTTKLTLPDFWIGPDVQVPFPGDSFVWKKYVGATVAIGF